MSFYFILNYVSPGTLQPGNRPSAKPQYSNPFPKHAFYYYPP